MIVILKTFLLYPDLHRHLSHGFILADHLAFRTGSLDYMRIVREKFHRRVSIQSCRFGKGFDLDRSDEDITAATQALIESEPEFQTMDEWRQSFATRLG